MVEEAVRLADAPIVTNQIKHYPGVDQSADFETCAETRHLDHLL